MTSAVTSVASTNREPFRALNPTDGFTKHSKINLVFFFKRLQFGKARYSFFWFLNLASFEKANT